MALGLSKKTARGRRERACEGCISAEGDISEYGVESGHQQRQPLSVDRILAICFEAAYSETLIVRLS